MPTHMSVNRGRQEALERLRKRFGLPDPVHKDHERVERGRRLDALLGTPVWKQDVEPLLNAMHHMANSQAKEDRERRDEWIGYQKALDDLAVIIGGKIQVGVAAAERLNRRYAERARGTESGPGGIGG